MKGYKVFNSDWTCRGFQYKVGETYEHKGNISICEKGFHFCREIAKCFNYYEFNPSNKVAEIEALGNVESDGDKSVTDKIKIVREISWEEMLRLANLGEGNTGLSNSGDSNSGNRNSGNSNSGNWNSGNWNSGNSNSGNSNSGNWNSGNWNSGNSNSGNRNSGDSNSGNRNSSDSNSGDWNSGNSNSGNWNSGDSNSGNWNSGNWNSGNRNSGDSNSGNWNSGNWNSGDSNSGNRNSGSYNSGSYNSGWHNSGFFNTKEATVRLFNRNTKYKYETIANCKGIKVLDWNYENNWWIYSINMTEDEKKEHPEHETLGGYLKVIPYKDACRLMWDKLDKEEKQAVKEIPYFDAEVFKEITGIDVNEEVKE